MRIGEIEVADSLVEEYFKKAGQRVVKEDEWISKAEQANLVAKARGVLGDQFNDIDGLAAIVKAHKENENKSKSQLELALAANKEMEKALNTYKGEVQNAKLAMRRKDVDEWFREGQEALKTPVIEPILRPFKEELYGLKDEEVQNIEFLRSAVKERLERAAEIQKGELAKLGLAGISAEDAKTSFGGGQTNVSVKESKGVQITNPIDLWGISKQGAASPMGVPIYSQRDKK